MKYKSKKSKEQIIMETEKLHKKIQNAKQTAQMTKKLEATEQGFQCRNRLGIAWFISKKV